ncbi:MAG: YdcF family protein [Nitrospiraceae bacterium]
MELTPFWFGIYKLSKYALYPLSWVLFLLGLLTLLALLPMSPDRHRWIRRLSVVSLLALYVIASPLTSKLIVTPLEAWHPPFNKTTSQRFDAIVVLGSGAYSHGTLRPEDELSNASRERTTCGVDLLLQGFAPKLVLSGGDATVFGSGPTESLHMKRWARKLGAPEEAVFTESRSRTTYENAIETQRMLGNASVLLVTSASHEPRAVALFRKQGLQPTPAPCGYYSKDRLEDGWTTLTVFDLVPQVGALELTTHALSEVAGGIVYWLTGKL